MLTKTSSKRRLTGVRGPRPPNEVSDSKDASISLVGEGELKRFSAGTGSSDTSILGERGAISWLNDESRLTSKGATLVSAAVFGDLRCDKTKLSADVSWAILGS